MLSAVSPLLAIVFVLLTLVGLVISALLLLFVAALILFFWRVGRRDPLMGVGYCFVQCLCRVVVGVFYRLRVRGAEHVPEQGGALIVANHASYFDVVLLGVAFRRPVRFLSWEGFERTRVMRLITRAMGTIPVAEEKAKDAIQKAAEALRRGELVCIFPEGSLTRNGGVLPLRRGFELIARRAEAPILPVAIDGMWGSLFSFSGGKFFWKRPKHFPRPVGVAIGQAYPAAEHATTRLRLLELAAEAFAMRASLDGHLGREVAAGLAAKGGAAALVDRTAARREFSGATLLALGWALAGELKRRTHARRVAIVLPPGVAAAVANLGCLLADKVPVNLNFSLGREQALSCQRRAEVDLVITAGAFRDKLAEKFPDFPWGEHVFDVADFLRACPRAGLVARLAVIRCLPISCSLALMGVPRRGGEKEAALLFTSGSSGQPKGVRLSHRNILANLRQIEDADILPDNAVLLSSLPVFHSFGFTIGLWYCLSRAPRLVTLPSPLDAAAAVKAIKEEKVTVVVGTPTFLRPYLRRGTAEDFASLEWAVVGAEKCPADLVQGFAAQLDTPMLEGYGITETSPVLSVNVPDRADAEAPGGLWVGNVCGSVGRPVIGIAVRFRDPVGGEILSSGQTGLLEIRGANVFLGYLDPAQTVQAMTADGWYRTGDLARLDEEGFLHLAGRLSRFSKIGGEMVPHGVIEEALRKVLGLAEATEPKVAVASAADPVKGEQLVVLHVDDVDPETLRGALAAEGLANLWIPKVFKKVPGIPILGTGKLDLNKLRELAQG
jgi:acyl-[acyl-carrier-protein]-phospholipid O-acyltransferase/long-chain-fatty-acid--[acyl-carrier-protein] ligase